MEAGSGDCSLLISFSSVFGGFVLGFGIRGWGFGMGVFFKA